MTSELLTSILVASVTCLAGAQTTKLYNITPEQVAHALSEKGITVASDRIYLAATVVSTVPNPALEVESIEMPPGESENSKHPNSNLWIKVLCREESECIPFYAEMDSPKGITPLSTHAANANTALKYTSFHKTDLDVVRAGASVILVIQDPRMEIQIPVICLESASIGRQIRVASLDRKHIYVGLVVSKSVVKGSL